MTNLLRFDDLQAILHQGSDHLPDHRKPSPNTRYTIQDAVLGAFGIFFTQSPSFLEYQRRLQHTKGHNNAQTLFGVEQIPCDNQVRTLLDPLAPSYLDPVFVEISKGLEQHHMLDHFRVLGDQLLVSLDGTTYFSSQTLHCPNCLTRQLSERPNALLSHRDHPRHRVPRTPRRHRLAPRVHHAARRGGQTGLRTAGGQTVAQQTCPGRGAASDDLTGR